MGGLLQRTTGATTMVELRGSHGHPAPFNVRYWGIGNQSWNCGSNFHDL
jgi:alpha-N-arabinofuranosidase